MSTSASTSSPTSPSPGQKPSQNVDPAELAKFSALAHRWWDPESEFRPLHQINPLRLDWINGLVPVAGKTIVDIGCGGGILAEAMARKGAHVKGIDLADKPLQIAKLHALEVGAEVDYEAISAEDLAAREPSRYDIVTCMEMLEHVPAPELVVAACAQLAKPGGWVFFSTINRNPKSFVMAIIGAEYVLNLLPKGTHEYAKFIKPNELLRAARASRLELIETRGLGYNPLTQVYSLNHDSSVNYLAATRKLT